MRIILDTGVLWRPEAIKQRAESEEDLVLPAIAYAERLRQLVARGIPRHRFDDLLARGEIAVEPFGRDQARALVRLATDERTWRRLARDALIAAHLGPADVLWTTNPRDFRDLGVLERQIVVVT